MHNDEGTPIVGNGRIAECFIKEWSDIHNLGKEGRVSRLCLFRLILFQGQLLMTMIMLFFRHLCMLLGFQRIGVS